MNYLSFNHDNEKSWLDIAPKLAQPLNENTPLTEPVILHTTDERANFIIGSMGEELDMKRKMYDDRYRPEYDRFDYNIANENNKEISDIGNKHDHTPPMSFFAIDNVADGIAWYQDKYPEMPDLVIETCARQQWGTIPKNRGEVRAEKKLNKANKKQEQWQSTHDIIKDERGHNKGSSIDKNQKTFQIKKEKVELDFN